MTFLQRRTLIWLEERRSVSRAPTDSDFETEALIHMDALFRFASRLTKDRGRAEDLLQETLLRAVRFWANYQKGTNCKAWLFRIMRNLYLNTVQVEQKSSQNASLEDTEEWYLYQHLQNQQESEEASPERIFLQGDWSPEILEALDQIPEEYRTALILSDVEEFSYQQIAEILNVPIGTVRSRLNRARGKLQKLLTEYVKENYPGLIPKTSKSESEIS